MTKYQAGYIALSSVIIISLLLVTITAALSLVSYYSRFNILESEYKQRSVALAQSCVDYAFSQLVVNPNYSGNECLNFSSNNCKVVSVTAGSYPKTIQSQAQYEKSYTNLSIVTNSSFQIQSWQELPQIITAACP